MNALYAVIASSTSTLWSIWKADYLERFINEREKDINFKKVYERLNEFINYCKRFIAESGESIDNARGKSDAVFRKIVKLLEECSNET